MSEPYLGLRQAAAQANQDVAASGLVIQAFGNASQVDRGERVFAIKPSGIPCRDVSANDVVVVSIDDGSIVWGSNRPSSDTPTHRILYREINSIGGIVHTHSMFATAWAQARRPIPCFGTTHADSFRGEVPVTRSLSRREIAGEYEANTGSVVGELFSTGRFDPTEAPGVLVASHGPFTWGVDAAAAVAAAASLEMIATLASHTVAIAPDITQVEDSLLDRHFSRKHGPSAYYGQ